MTLNPDIINACFEFIGAVFTSLNTLRVYKDKGYAGVFVPAIVFFFSWGGWNLYFYPSVGAYWSLGAGVMLFLANLTWVAALLYYGPMQKRDW